MSGDLKDSESSTFHSMNLPHLLPYILDGYFLPVRMQLGLHLLQLPFYPIMLLGNMTTVLVLAACRNLKHGWNESRGAANSIPHRKYISGLIRQPHRFSLPKAVIFHRFDSLLVTPG